MKFAIDHKPAQVRSARVRPACGDGWIGTRAARGRSAASAASVAAAVLAVLAMAAAACSGAEVEVLDELPEDVRVTDSEPTVTTQVGGETGASTAEAIEWFDCEGLDCGTLDVPLDYRDTAKGTLTLVVAVHRARDPQRRIGYLVVNPGGPGGSGVEMAATALAGPGLAFTAPILDRFDIVGFDPRGVSLSEPQFGCGGPGEALGILAEVEPPYDSDAELAAGESAARLCIESMSDAAGLLHSEYVARDIDQIRKALGADQISYYGASYGSTLGVWYATLFGDRVRAMVVDGADNPVDDLSTAQARIENAIEEIAQFEVLLGEALDACDSPECPIYNDGDPRGYFAASVDALEAVNDDMGGHPLAGALGVLTPLYDQQQWPQLWQGLANLVEDDDPSVLSGFARIQLGPDSGGITFTEHVNCLDSWAIYPHLDRETRLSDEVQNIDAIKERLPLLSLIDVEVAATCPFYDIFDLPAFDGVLDGGDVPIVVIGNRTDPATPFSESQELVDETLANGYLVEAEHEAHVVYPAVPCVNELIEAALIDQTLPSQRLTVCEPDG